MTDFLDHNRASALVRNWKPTPQGNAFGLRLEDELETFTLAFPGEGYLIQVSFSTVKDRPDVMRVRSTNWRCEHEPSGLFSREDCRKFYQQLVKAGFVRPDHPSK